MNFKVGGAEPKKIAWLSGLLVALIGVWIYNSSQTPDYGPGAPPQSTGRPLTAPKDVGSLPAPPPAVTRRDAMTPKRAGSRAQLRSSVQDFKPKLFDKDNPVDPTRVDPTLGTQLIAKLQSVALTGGGRSLFAFGAAAVEVPKGPLIKVTPKPKATYPFYGPVKPVEKPLVAEMKPPAPPPPPIPLKFYGFVLSKKDGGKRAFFMEGEEIYIASEGETMKKRFKLIKVGVNSAVVEDVPNKNQQTLPLVEEQQASND